MECTPISFLLRRLAPWRPNCSLRGSLNFSLRAFCEHQPGAARRVQLLAVVALRDFNVELLAQHGGSLFDQLYLQAYAQRHVAAVNMGIAADALRRRESSSSLRPVVPITRRAPFFLQYSNTAELRWGAKSRIPLGAGRRFRYGMNQRIGSHGAVGFAHPREQQEILGVFEQKLYDGGAHLAAGAVDDDFDHIRFSFAG
jgi:hypothetical protein